MSLVTFIQLPEVRSQLKPFRPSPPRKINAPLRVAPRTENWRLVGTAFDYLLRFEIKRRAAHARDEGWTVRLYNFQYFPVPQQQVELVGFCERILCQAEATYSSFIRTPSPTSSEIATLAVHAIRLASLEPIF